MGGRDTALKSQSKPTPADLTQARIQTQVLKASFDLLLLKNNRWQLSKSRGVDDQGSSFFLVNFAVFSGSIKHFPMGGGKNPYKTSSQQTFWLAPKI